MEPRRRILVWTGVLLTLALVLVARLIGAFRTEDTGLASGGLLWGLVSLVGLAWVLRNLDFACAHPFGAESKVLGLIAVLPFLWEDLGNPVPPLSVFALVLVVGGFLVSRRGRPGTAGLLFGCAMLVDFALVLVVPWFLYRLRLRAIAGVSLVLCVFLGAAWVEPDLWRWYSASATGIDAANQSLYAVIEPCLGSFSPAARTAVYAAGVTASVVVLLLTSWRRYPGLRLRFSVNEVSVALAAAVVLAPVSTRADFVFLLPAALVGVEASRRSSPPVLRRAATCLLGGAFLCSVASFFTTLEEVRFSALVSASFFLALSAYPRFYPTTRAFAGSQRSADSRPCDNG